jgi:hypothetical protein
MSDDFLARWSRRKSEAKQAAPAPVEEALDEAPVDLEPTHGDGAAAGPVAQLGEAPDAPVEITAEEIAALPPVESLSSASDLAPFLRRGVPMLLRNAALRRMWTVDPAIRDFLNDAREYAYDWNTPGGVPGLGPMSATDDVKAMVRRIFNDPVEEPAVAEKNAMAPGEGKPAAAVESPTIEDQEPAAADDRPVAVVEESAPLIPTPPVATTPDAATQESDALDARTASAPQAATQAGSQRPRRHGGATPA